MMRRYPVRSVLSERKMFSNGGMLPTSKPIESSMNQASGIMASSSPLIDAVSQEILAPMTGGAMPMAQGGVARFREGGISDTREKINRINKIVALVRKGASMDEAIRIVDGEGIPDVQVDSRAGPPRKDMNFLDPSVSVDKFNAIYGEQLPEGGPPSINVNEDLLSLIPEANRASFAEELAANERAKNLNTPASSMRAAPPPTDMSFLPDFKSSAAMFDTVAQPDLPESGGSVPRNTVDPRVAERLIELGTTREIVQDPGLPESGGTQPLEPFALDKLVRQRMADLGNTEALIRQGTTPEGTDSTVAEAVIEAAPPPTDMSFLDPTASVDAFDAIYGEQLPESGIQSSAMSPYSIVAARRAAQGSITPEEKVFGDSSLTVDQELELGEGPKAKAGFEIPQPMPSSISKPVFDPDREVSVDEELDALDSYFGSDNSQQIPTEELPEAQGDLAVEPSERLEEALRGGDVKTDIGIGKEFTVKEAGDSTVAGSDVASRKKGAVTEGTESPTTVAEDKSPAKSVAETFDKKDMSEKEAVKTIADYKKDFMDEMPEYEGMSESEKGYALMEAGLRVAAGESSNAITNIAKGLKGFGATFAKDEKEKRAWSRQVELSASKYGLQKVAQDTAELRADAKADRNLYTKVFRVRPGQTFERNGEVRPEGSTVILKVGEIKDGTVDLAKLQTEDSISTELKAYNNRLKLQLKGLKDNTIKPDEFEATKKAYLKDSSQVRTNVAVTGYLKNALAALNTEDVTGFRGAGKDIVLKIGNATGLKEFSEEAFGKLTTKAQYQRFTEGATTKFIEGLISEGGKISDFERDLARELSGAIGTRLYSGITADTEVLTGKIKSFISDLNASSDLSLRSMAISEKTWSTSYNTADIDLRKEIGSYGQILKDSRRPLAGKSTAIPKGTILWKDIMEVDAAGKPLGLNKVFKRTLK